MSKQVKIRSKYIKGYTHQSLYCVYLSNCLLTQILQLLCKYNQCILAYRHSQNALLPKPSIRMGKRGDLWNLKMAWLLVQDRNFRNCWSTGVDKNHPNSRKYPASGSSLGENALLMSVVRGEWLGCSELIGRSQITTQYNQGMKGRWAIEAEDNTEFPFCPQFTRAHHSWRLEKHCLVWGTF